MWLIPGMKINQQMKINEFIKTCLCDEIFYYDENSLLAKFINNSANFYPFYFPTLARASIEMALVSHSKSPDLW